MQDTEKSAFSILMYVLSTAEETTQQIYWGHDKQLILAAEVSFFVDEERINGGRPQSAIKPVQIIQSVPFIYLGYLHLFLLCYRAFVGPTLGGFLNEKLGFEWASAIQGGWAVLSVSDKCFAFRICCT